MVRRLQNIPEAIKPDARCRLFRRATQSIPKNRPELYESEAYVSIWLGFAVEQAKLGQRQEGADALEYMRSEGIGKRSRAFYETWALCEVASGHLEKGRDALKAGLRALPTRERPSLQTLAKCSDEELQTKVRSSPAPSKSKRTRRASSRSARGLLLEVTWTPATTLWYYRRRHNTKEGAHEARGHRLYAQVEAVPRPETAARTTRRAAVKKSVSPEDETAEAPRSTIKTTSTSSSVSVHEEDSSIAIPVVVLGSPPSPSSLGSETRSPWTVLLTRS